MSNDNFDFNFEIDDLFDANAKIERVEPETDVSKGKKKADKDKEVAVLAAKKRVEALKEVAYIPGKSSDDTSYIPHIMTLLALFNNEFIRKPSKDDWVVAGEIPSNTSVSAFFTGVPFSNLHRDILVATFSLLRDDSSLIKNKNVEISINGLLEYMGKSTNKKSRDDLLIALGQLAEASIKYEDKDNPGVPIEVARIIGPWKAPSGKILLSIDTEATPVIEELSTLNLSTYNTLTPQERNLYLFSAGKERFKREEINNAEVYTPFIEVVHNFIFNGEAENAKQLSNRKTQIKKMLTRLEKEGIIAKAPGKRGWTQKVDKREQYVWVKLQEVNDNIAAFKRWRERKGSFADLFEELERSKRD